MATATKNFVLGADWQEIARAGGRDALLMVDCYGPFELAIAEGERPRPGVAGHGITDAFVRQLRGAEIAWARGTGVQVVATTLGSLPGYEAVSAVGAREEIRTATATAAGVVGEAQAAAQEAQASADRVDLGALDQAVSTSTTAAETASTAAAVAVTARDAAAVNADIYFDIATGRAAVADGEQFQVGVGDDYVRYRRDSPTTQTQVGSFAGAAAVRANREEIKDVKRATTGALLPTENLFDKDDPDVAAGHIVSGTTGLLVATSGRTASGYVRVSPGSYYASPGTPNHAWYDKDKVFLSGSNTFTNSLTAPAGAAFLRYTINTAAGGDPERAYVVAGTTPLASYVPYGSFVAGDRLPTIEKANIGPGAVGVIHTDFVTRGKNIFNIGAFTPGSYFLANGTETASGTLGHSDLVPVTGGETYVASTSVRYRTAYDKNGNVLPSAGSNENWLVNVPWTVGANVAFVRFSVLVGSVANGLQIEAGSVSTSFEPWGYRLDPSIIVAADTADAMASKWNGAVAASFGDSITAQAEWQPKVAAALGLSHTAYGIGGRRVSGASGMCQDAAINAIPTDVELLLVLGGTNDWSSSVPLGSGSSANTADFYGALNQMCEKLTTRLPTARIIIMTTPYGEAPGKITSDAWPSAAVNLQGLTTRDYAEACRNAARRWGFPIIDLSECGWNTVNLAGFMKADGALIHPNAGAGGNRLAEVVIGRLRALEPLAA